MTSKLVVNTIEADTGISSVSFASSISLSSTSVFHLADAGFNIGADTNVSRLGNGILGFKINGAEKFRIDSSGHIKAVGVCTATHFYGDGSNLTGITGTTINGNTNNYVVTATGTANTLQGEAGLTYNGLQLNISNTVPELFLTDTNSNNSYGRVRGNGGNLILSADVNNATAGSIINFEIDGAEKARIDTNGGVGIGTNNFSGQLNNEVGLAVHGSSNDNCRISITTPTKTNSRIGYFGLSNRFGMDVHYGLEVRDAEASYATRFKIDNNGYVTMNQPYGYVRFNAHNDTQAEQRQTNVYTHTVQNGMSHSSGRLTVPATGKYYIGIHGNILDNAAAAQYLYINGSKQAGWNWQQNDGTAYWKSSMVGGVIALNANDYLDIYVVGKQDNHSWNMFTVYMLG